jgi:aromatic ring-cleaving dioxygenase
MPPSVRTADHPFRDPAEITAYHAHVYYDPSATREEAAFIREAVGARFPDARLGRWHDTPVGPHPQAMYQIVFQPDRVARSCLGCCSIGSA